MNYQEALQYITSTYKLGMKKGTENILYLLNKLGNPQNNIKVIHVAGTNGKGSTCSFLSTTLIEAGYKVGLYTSPFLEVFNERMRINGKNIPDDKLAELTTIVKEKVDEMVKEGMPHPTEFEVTTAIGFLYFDMEKVDYLVLEVGLGGRHDATNVIDEPVMTVITSISIDHVDQLGDKLSGIAYEKAGIIKSSSPLVLYPQKDEAREVVLKVAEEKDVEVYEINTTDVKVKGTSLFGQDMDMNILGESFKDLKISLIGDHQSRNALTAATTLKLLSDKNLADISHEDIVNGLRKTKWGGRLELLKKNPITIIDGAHNEEGAAVLADSISKYLHDYKVTLVFGMLKDKDVDKVLSILLPVVDEVIATTPNSDRALTAELLCEKIKAHNKRAVATNNINEAIEIASKIKGEKEAIIYAGSLYLIGEVRSIIKEEE